MSNAPVKRDAHGHLLPGSRLNPGGRPRGVIEEVRERLGPHTAEFCAALVELVRSPNETTRLAAVREFFDRMLGKPPVAIDQTVAKFDVGASIQALYLSALQQANKPAEPKTIEGSGVIDITPTPPAAVPALAPSAQDEADQINSTTDEW
jgi:hypothetical protein